MSDDAIENAGWLFEVVFDYGEHDMDAPTPRDADQWTCRVDPFSSCRPGFEVRTYRLCRRVLMFHHFPDEPEIGNDCLVSSTEFTYFPEADPVQSCAPVYSLLHSVTRSGYKRRDGGYLKQSLPPVEFEYSKPVVQDTVEEVDAADLENLPAGLDGAAYRWVDLHGEGISGILTEQGGNWYYKRNLSPVNLQPYDSPASSAVKFAPLELVASRPNLSLNSGQAQFMDLAGDGRPDLVVLDGPAPGLYEHDGDKSWSPFRPFASRLNRDLQDPNLKFIDLDGDGLADLLITEDNAFLWHPSLGEEGFGPGRRTAQAVDEEKGPRLIFADSAQSVYLADLNGDGLTDLARIRNGEVCYWPNLGYGRFGPKITMDNAPLFDRPEQFNQKRVLLADIDGTGTIDLIYLHRDGVRLYFNQSGNSWSTPRILKAFPRIDDPAGVTPVDLLGNGTACLVWSSPLPGDARRQMRYVDLMGGQKPHLLIKVANNLGAETRLWYAPSTKFYLQDKQDGKPWITRLPFPVHVVERVETYDYISRNRFITRYAYHHGYFDGVEREFRGFGLVEQWDTEELAALSGGGHFPAGANTEPSSHIPPVLTKTWFHTGAYLERDHISNFFAGLRHPGDTGEYYREPGLTGVEARALLLEDTLLPPGLTLEEEREACRALKGAVLRREIYALDGTPKAPHPYTVTEQNYTIRRLQPRGPNRHASFFTHPREAVEYHYERNPADPRVTHSLTLEVDPFGNVLKEAKIAYGRREKIRIVDDTGAVTEVGNPAPAELDPPDREKQTATLITYTENRFANFTALDKDSDRNPGGNLDLYPDDYHAPLPCETRVFEITGIQPENNKARFGFDEWTRDHFALPASATEIPYEQTADSSLPQKRLIEHIRILYRPDDLGAAENNPLAQLPLGVMEPLALPGETYKLAFTPGLLSQVFKRPQNGSPPEDLLPDPAGVLGGRGPGQGGYVSNQTLRNQKLFPADNGDPFWTRSDMDNHWWVPAGRHFLSPAAAHNAAEEAAYARRHFFHPCRFQDPFGQTTTTLYDQYDLLVLETCDPLGNRITAGERDPETTRPTVKKGLDYRVLQPWLIMDANRNRSAVVFDALGLVAASAVMGKPEDSPQQGDYLDPSFPADLSGMAIDSFYDAPDPHLSANRLLQTATNRIIYGLHRFYQTRRTHPLEPEKWEPVFTASLARETHVSALRNGEETKIQVSFSYSDGFGREIQKKIQAEPGPVPSRDAAGRIIVDADGWPQMTAEVVTPRWVGDGWTVFNNKGQPVRQFEPFFTGTHRFEFDVRIGVSPVFFYDPPGRVVAVLHPNNTYEKIVFNP